MGFGRQIRSHVLFRNRDFLYYFLGRLISATGDKVFTIAMSVWIVSEGTPADKMHLGFLLAMNTLPVVLFGPFAGGLADRINRKTCMLLADGMRFFILLAAFLLLISNRLGITWLYGVCFLLATFVPLFESAAGASIAHLVEEKDLSRAVALDGSVVNMSEILGASLGGILVATIHFEGALAFNALSFVASFFLISRVHRKLTAQGAHTDYLKEIGEGFSYLQKNRPIALLLVVFALLNFFTAPVFILIPLLVKYTLHLPVAHWVAAYETSLALGAGLTALYLSCIHSFHKIYLKMTLALCLFGTAFLLTSISSAAWPVCLYLFLAGAALAVVNTLALGLFQHQVPDAMKGRFFAMMTTVCFAAIPISYILTGYLSRYISAEHLFLLNGVMIVVMGLILSRLPRVADQIGDVDQKRLDHVVD